ncbi:RQC-minor-2 family DNA-binding protein [Jeotgalibacillus salarius]|uniref:Uncharacterized protein n=1 Tax=Jeotgalibacillus salarius TaxID=546023 RepID=A0A4Y8LL78_9BACL|nr:RQC-minor-2 family DNA-binding protein [Jeotgalibacillus salarius]TFE01475.1 hypothetical protein E2626_07830 [Jeotgalibacillus salarius]
MMPGVKIEPYDKLLFMPVGRRYANIRSIGHKEERAVLSRLQQAVHRALPQFSYRELKDIKEFLHADCWRMPVPVTREEELYPQLMRPEMFLWQEHSAQRGLPIDESYFYGKIYSRLSAEGLHHHVSYVLKDYAFCAKLHRMKREYWLDQIYDAYSRHPFIKLAKEKNHVVEAVEKMNRSSLLAVLKYPEDIAYWRHRVEIVMRPYRDIPAEWRWEMCTHEKELAVDGEALVCTCPVCEYAVKYHVNEERIELREEPIMERTVKRIATIERQLNEIAAQSMNVVGALRDVQDVKLRLETFSGKLEQLIELKDELGLEAPEVVGCYEQLKAVRLPEERVEPTLMSLSEVMLPDTKVLKAVQQWKTLEVYEAALDELIAEWTVLLEANQPKPDDVMVEVEGYQMTRAEVERVEAFLDETELTLTLHLLAQTLMGEPTNKVRTLGLHETAVFGMLGEWPEKYVVRAVKKLFKDKI